MNKLRFIRELRGYAQAYMAIKLGIKQNTYSGYEADTTRIKDAMWEKIAIVLKVAKLDLTSPEPVLINLHATESTQNDIVGNNVWQIENKELFDAYKKSKENEIATLKAYNTHLLQEIELLQSKE